jgi:hypothetical protein
MNPEEIARLKAAGFSDAEIASYTRATPAAQSFASESTAQRGSVSAPRAASPLAMLRDTGRAAGQGATFGFADEAEAGVRTLGGLVGDYTKTRDGIRSQNDAFSEAHPITSFLANVGGGLLTGGGTLAAAKGTGRLAQIARATLPKTNATATAGARFLQGVKTGGIAGGLAGAGGAKEFSDVPQSVAINAGLGAGLGGALTGASDVVRGTRNIVSRIGQGQDAPGVVRRAIRADAPEDGAMKRLLARMGSQRMGVDDFASASGRADAPDIAAEVLGAKGIRDLRTARGLGYDAPQMIEDGLTTRARNDVGRVRSVVRDELGEQVDDTALPLAKRLEAQTASAPLYRDALEGVSIEDPRLVSMLERPAIRSAYNTARRLAANDGDALPDVGSVMRGASRGADDVVARTTPLPDDGLPRNLTALADDDLNTAMARVAQARDADLAESQLIPDNVLVRVEEEGAAGAEDLRGAIEAAGYDVDEWQAAKTAMARARFRLRSREASMARLNAEAERRGGMPAPLPREQSLPTPDAAPELPRLTGRQLQYVKLALDDAITGLEGKAGGTSTTEFAQLVKARGDVDNLLYEFSNAAEDGSSLWGQANAAYARPMREAEAFRAGVRGGRNIQAPDAPRLLAGDEAEWTSRGVANTLQDDLSRMSDGAAGPIRDPGPMLMGSDAARARLEVAAGGDLGRIARIEDAAGNTSRRLRTRQTVLGGSQTAEKLADQAEQGLDPSAVLTAIGSPARGALSALGDGAKALQRNVVGQDMDALARLLMAGGPNQMSRAELVALIRKALPAIEAQQQRGVMLRGQAANQVGQRVQP